MSVPPIRTPEVPLEVVERALRARYIPGEGGLRDEDRKKAREIRALLGEIARIGRHRVVVEAAAGHAYAGLLAAELVGGIEELILVERDAGRAMRAQAASAGIPAKVTVHTGDAGDAALWPARPDVAIGLHACGAASDAILDAAVAARARWILLVPCCYARTVAFSATAELRAEALGIPEQAEVRRAFVTSLIDAERTLRLEAAGYEVTVAAFVPKSVSGHNLLWRCRWMGEGRRMKAAEARLARLRG